MLERRRSMFGGDTGEVEGRQLWFTSCRTWVLFMLISAVMASSAPWAWILAIDSGTHRKSDKEQFLFWKVSWLTHTYFSPWAAHSIDTKARFPGEERGRGCWSSILISACCGTDACVFQLYIYIIYISELYIYIYIYNTFQNCICIFQNIQITGCGKLVGIGQPNQMQCHSLSCDRKSQSSVTPP